MADSKINEEVHVANALLLKIGVFIVIPGSYQISEPGIAPGSNTVLDAMPNTRLKPYVDRENFYVGVITGCSRNSRHGN
ncbi:MULTISPECIES: hypothetical protein [Pseudomonas]|jgi:hypothetical protein|uniref:hypothetical protein n=1 Tax=Pseudomonas TaxID=286 RepID=UPI00155DA21B|nr:MULTISPECIES: hypothetical protein [Pseudomonas]MBS4087434.1 hypothetical protein [Pseudomonas rustica]